jgi:hypothetical protein
VRIWKEYWAYIPSSFKVEGRRAFDEYKSQDVFIEPHRLSHGLADK